MDFKGIQVTLAVMAQALIDGRIDCKTAGRLVVELQTMSKLLWLYHRDHRGTQREKALTTKDTRSTSFSQAQGRSGQAPEDEGLAGLRMLKECEQSGSANRMRSAEIIVIRRTGGAGTHAERVHGPPDVVRAA